MVPKYKRILLKLSGESLMGNKSFGLITMLLRSMQPIKATDRDWR
jgi:uridylate kinase